MFISIIVISIIIGLLFCTSIASLIFFIFHSTKQNNDAKRKSFKILIISLITWVLLVVINIFLTISFVYKNKENIIKVPAEMVGKGLALTGQNIEKNWDKNRLEQLKNLQIFSSSISFKIEEGEKIYDIELIFENNSPTEIKLYFDILTDKNYLVVCDRDDFAYPLDSKYGIIPFGKSKNKFTVTVPADVDITYARFVNSIIKLE